MKYKIIKNNIISCFAAVVLTVVVCLMTYSSFMESAMSVQAENQAYVLREICENNSENPVSAIEEIQTSFKNRVTLIGFDDKVIFDSIHDEHTLENHLERQEVADALEKGKGDGKRYSNTDGTTNYYYALELEGVGIVRVGIKSSTFMTEAILTNLPVIVLVIMAILYMIFVVSARTTQRIVNTIENFNFDETDSTVYEELSPFINKIEAQNQALTHQAQKTRAEKDKLQSIFSNMEESIIVCDRKKMVVQLNRQANRIFGVKEGDRLFEIIENDDLNCALERVISGQKAHGLLEMGKVTYQYTISPNVQNGEITGSIIIFLDITQQVESQKMRRQFTANVTHELKTPLTSILGYSQLISSGIAKPEDVAGFAGIIEKNAQQLLTLIEDIMQLSSLDEGADAEKTQVNMKTVVNDIIADLQPVLEKKQIQLSADMEDVAIMANHKHIGDICRNLISNAIKYNKPCGSIDVMLKTEDNNVVFKVKDTGIGLAPHHKDKIFQRFYVVDKSRNKNISSTGLGLSIVKHIVTGMGGTIELESELGKGSQFTVKLPMEQK